MSSKRWLLNPWNSRVPSGRQLSQDWISLVGGSVRGGSAFHRKRLKMDKQIIVVQYLDPKLRSEPVHAVFDMSNAGTFEWSSEAAH